MSEWRTLHVAYEFDRDTSRPERVRASVREAGEQLFLDLRIFRWNKQAEEFRPTRRGLSLPLDSARELSYATRFLADYAADMLQ